MKVSPDTVAAFMAILMVLAYSKEVRVRYQDSSLSLFEQIHSIALFVYRWFVLDVI